MTPLTPKAEEYLETLAREPDTIKSYRNGLAQYFYTVGMDAAPTTENYTKYLKTIKGKSSSTQRVYTTAILKFFRYCGVSNIEELKELTKHYTRQGNPNEPVDFDEEGIEQLLAYAETMNGDLFALRDRAFIFTVVGYGLRIHEAIELKVGDIDWQGRRAVIRGKRNKKAVIRFSDKAVKYLQEYFTARARAIETRQSIKSQPLFAAHDIRAKKRVTPIGISGIRKAFKQRLEEAGIEPDRVRVHDLRHYFITMIYRESGKIRLAQEHGRHDSIAMTQRYTHLVKGELDTSYDQIINKRK